MAKPYIEIIINILSSMVGDMKMYISLFLFHDYFMIFHLYSYAIFLGVVRNKLQAIE